MAHRNHLRWYNPKLGDFEWRKAPRTDEEALRLLEDSPYSPMCARTYREWRDLGATVAAALIRAGETARGECDEAEGDAH